MSRVLITDSVHPILMERLEAMGFVCDYFTDYNTEKVAETIHIYVGIVINSKIKVSADLIDRAEKLQFIARLGSGMEIIDVTYAEAKGIHCINSPEGNRDAVAEHAIGMLLALKNNLLQADRELRSFEWHREKNRGLELMHQTVGLLGYGNTGKAMAKKLSGFDVNVLVYDKYLKNYSDNYAQEASMEEIFDKCDILSLHLPLTIETRYLVNQEFLNSFKKEFILINTSRGAIVSTNTLLQGLSSGKLKGVCLDVFENERVATFTDEEKASYNSLYGYPNTVLSPHVAGWTSESKYKLANILADKIAVKLSI